MIRDYADYYGRLDLLRQAVVRSTVGTILTTRMVTPWSELVRSEFYCDFMARHDLYDGIEAQVLSDSEFRVGIAVLCSSKVGVFEQEDVRLLALLLPHLRQAFRTKMRLGSIGIERDCALEALDHLSHGILIVDPQARVIYANSASDRILCAGDGLGVDIAGGRRLRATNAKQTAVLRHLIARVAGCDPTAALSGSRSNDARLDRAAGGPLLISAAPLKAEASWNPAPRRAVLLLVSAPEEVTPSLSTGLRTLYGLTSAEVVAAGAIARGHGVKEAAKASGVSPSTVRWHLKHVYQKTGTARQAELIRLIERLGALGKERAS